MGMPAASSAAASFSGVCPPNWTIAPRTRPRRASVRATSSDSVELSARDISRFYDEHREDFKRERVYTIEMASLSKLPVTQDTLDILDDLEKARPFFTETEDDSLYLVRNASERAYTRAFFAALRSRK